MTNARACYVLASMIFKSHESLKWFVAGFISALACFFIAICILTYFFTPLLKVDESTGRIQLFGGLVDVQARDMITKLSKESSFVFGTIEGVYKVPPAAEILTVKFGSGDVRIDFNASDEMNWDCDGAGKSTKVVFDEAQKNVTLDLSSAFVDCDLSLPEIRLVVEGARGELELRKYRNDVDVRLGSGNVGLEPVENLPYSYDLKVGIGQVDSEISSDPAPESSEAVKVKVEIKSGDIIKLD